jgi:hypothetical protein
MLNFPVSTNDYSIWNARRFASSEQLLCHLGPLWESDDHPCSLWRKRLKGSDQRPDLGQAQVCCLLTFYFHEVLNFIDHISITANRKFVN